MTTIPEETGFADLFDAELTPLIRRLGERARGGSEPIDGDDVPRRAVWRGLAGMGALRPADPENGQGLRDMLRLHELMGNALYQSPYADTMTAAEMIAGGAPADLEAGIAAGDVTVGVAVRDRPGADPRRPGPLETDPVTGAVTGIRSFVPYAADADHLLVVGTVGTGAEARLTAVLVPSDGPGVTLRRHDDLGRGDLYAVRLDGAPVLPGLRPPGGGWAARWRVVLAWARLRQAGYLTGLCEGALRLGTEYARRRQVFGQPLAKLQAPAFRLAALAARTEAVRTLVHRTSVEADAGADVELPACQALLLAGELAVETAADVMQIHGSYGLTEGCDAQLFYRRAVVDAMTLGTAHDLRRHAADLLTRRRPAAGEASDDR